MRKALSLVFVLLVAVIVTGNAAAISLYVRDVTSDGVTLTWAVNPLGFIRYELYIDDGSGWECIETFTQSITNSHTVEDLTPGKTYHFYLRYVRDEASGYESRSSNVVEVTTEQDITLCLVGIVSVVVVIVLIALAIGWLATRRRRRP